MKPSGEQAFCKTKRAQEGKYVAEESFFEGLSEKAEEQAAVRLVVFRMSF